MSLPRAFCTFCTEPRAVLKSGLPVRHNFRFQRTMCNGVKYFAEQCTACDGTGQVKTIWDEYLDHPCNVCKGHKLIIGQEDSQIHQPR